MILTKISILHSESLRTFHGGSTIVENKEGGLQLQLQNQRKKLLKVHSVEQIAEALEETPEKIQQLIDKMS